VLDIQRLATLHCVQFLYNFQPGDWRKKKNGVQQFSSKRIKNKMQLCFKYSSSSIIQLDGGYFESK
jgi:hypothetical protein